MLEVDVSALVSDESPMTVRVADASEICGDIPDKILALRRQIALLSPEEMKRLNDALADAGVMLIEK